MTTVELEVTTDVADAAPGIEDSAGGHRRVVDRLVSAASTADFVVWLGKLLVIGCCLGDLQLVPLLRAAPCLTVCRHRFGGLPCRQPISL